MSPRAIPPVARIPRSALLRFAVFAALLVVGFAVLRWTPLSVFFTKEALIAALSDLRNLWWAPLVLIGLYLVASPLGLPISPLNLVLTQKTLMGSIYGTSNARIEIPKLLNMYKNGQIKLDELVTNTYSLKQINLGYDDLIAGKNIRGVIKF